MSHFSISQLKFLSVSLTLCLILSSKTSNADPEVQPPPAGKIPSALVHLSKETKFAFLVDKDHRTLTLWKNSQPPSLVASYPTDMGRNKGNKLYRGDHKTPEGIYFFLETYEQPYLDFSLYGKRAFTMDYPNFFDRIEKKTGSGIWLHAIPDTQSLNRGSRGCVVVRNEVIEKLKDFISLRNTPIIVQNKVDYMTPKEWTQKSTEYLKWLQGWKEAWENKNIENYISFYDGQFKSMGMNLNKWKTFKESLNEKYSFIRVDLDHIDVFKHGEKYVFRFLQNYQSDQNKDVGQKHLYVKKDSEGQLKILGEDWSPLKVDSERTLSASHPLEN